MREYSVDYSARVIWDIDRLTRWAAQQHTASFAERYVNDIIDEIKTLSYLADVLPKCKYRLPKVYHPKANTLVVGHRKLTVIFHIDGEYVIVDKILPSCMITY
ncbi:MAG: hypothetical protein IJ789_05720 [Bacteroidales bacterium]|nr:hypothetical protein [Bacteroidales bacterium]